MGFLTKVRLLFPRIPDSSFPESGGPVSYSYENTSTEFTGSSDFRLVGRPTEFYNLSSRTVSPLTNLSSDYPCRYLSWPILQFWQITLCNLDWRMSRVFFVQETPLNRVVITGSFIVYQ